MFPCLERRAAFRRQAHPKPLRTLFGRPEHSLTVGVHFDESAALQQVVAGNYVVGPDTDLDTVPLGETLR